MNNSIYDLSNEQLEEIFQLIAKELSSRNNSSYELELQELHRIKLQHLDISLRTDTQSDESFLLDVNSYYNGTDTQQQIFINDWISATFFSRTSYTIELMKKIKELRISNGLTQKEVANRLNISSQAYGHYENGKREPDITTLIQLSRIFEVSLDYLFDLRIQHGCSTGVSKSVLLQPEANFVNRLKNNGVHIYMFNELSDEHINIISTIIKQVTPKLPL